MNMNWRYLLLAVFFGSYTLSAQSDDIKNETASRWFSLGGRSTISLFDHDGAGIGTGGQFRIQPSNRVNTDWFFDYISINMQNKVRSEYYHIGWSVLYYPSDHLRYPVLVQPYVLAGHCFDYNIKTAMMQPGNSKSRWGSAVQAGAGLHFNLTERFDITLMSQYMIHLTRPLDARIEGDLITIEKESGSALEGHLLTTLSVNYKIFKFGRK